MLVYSYWQGKSSVVCQANNSLPEEELQHCKQNQVGESAPTGAGQRRRCHPVNEAELTKCGHNCPICGDLSNGRGEVSQCAV